MRSLPLLFSVSCAIVAYARQPPSVCMLLSPTVTLTAGQSISAIVQNDQGRPCLATLAFSNDEFLPVTFSLQPTTCLGYQLAEILIPTDAPNGNVSVLWECAGDNTSTCMKASIQGASENSDALMLQQTGTMECLVPYTSSSTLSTLVQEILAPTTISGSTSRSTSGSTLASTTTSSSTSTSTSTTSSTSSSTSGARGVAAVENNVQSTSTTTTGSTTSSTDCPCSQATNGGTPFG